MRESWKIAQLSLWLFFLLTVAPTRGEQLSRSFELRFYSNSPEANGVTDFKGPTAVFDTVQRIKYLRHYADCASRFFEDPNLDTRVVSDEEVEAALSTLKPQPLPQVRRRIPLKSWKWLGYRQGQNKAMKVNLDQWNEIAGVEVRDAALVVTHDRARIEKSINPQSWRFFVSFRIKLAAGDEPRVFSIMNNERNRELLSVRFDANGRLSYSTGGKLREEDVTFEAGRWYAIKVEVDLVKKRHQEINSHIDVKEYGRYNLYVDDMLVADYVPVDDPAVASVDTLRFEFHNGDVLDDVWGVGYDLLPTEKRDYPYSIKTFIDENFSVKPDIKNWTSIGYDDTDWQEAELPHVHGGERYEGEHIYLRHKLRVGHFDAAVLNVETLDPCGDVWVNGEKIAIINNREPHRLDISRYLKPAEENLIAVHVNPFLLEKEKRMHHAATDLNIGWFAGRITLDLREKVFIDYVFAHTKSVDDPALLQTRIALRNDRGKRFDGRLRLNIYKWFPKQTGKAVATVDTVVNVDPAGEKTIEQLIPVPKPNLWTYQSPYLYRLHVLLEDNEGRAVDDEMITTGIRTVSQDGGVFRINDRPEILRAPLVFGDRPPLDKIAAWNRCAPIEWLVRELLMIKKMNGNGARMSVHHADVLGINDPRWPEIADQLGIMWIWGTTPWVRMGSVWQSDWSGLEKYVKQVYNHPSIVIWQPSNHPSFKNWDDVIKFYKLIYNTIYPLDPSRLITPTADLRRVEKVGPYSDDGRAGLDGKSKKPADPVWTAHMISRGSMDTPTGYGYEWDVLRQWPVPNRWEGGVFMPTFLASRDRAYFNFEQEESIGQPNWNLRKGKPHYRVHSYEWEYDEGSIGRRLTADEWRESQAWQAFSAYESIRKMRCLDYDGFSWCCLHGGPNTATYQKPLIDYYGHAKLAFYANRMAFQDVLAGSKNVDLAYGPDDHIPIMVFNLGEAKTVDVMVKIKTCEGKSIYQKIFKNVKLEAGRTVKDLPPLKPSWPKSDFFIVEYTVFGG